MRRTMFATMGLAWTWLTTLIRSIHTRSCSGRMRIRAPISGWLPSSESSTGWVGESGLRAATSKVRCSALLCVIKTTNSKPFLPECSFELAKRNESLFERTSIRLAQKRKQVALCMLNMHKIMVCLLCLLLLFERSGRFRGYDGRIFCLPGFHQANIKFHTGTGTQRFRVFMTGDLSQGCRKFV